jgi:hypothetical protein
VRRERQRIILLIPSPEEAQGNRRRPRLITPLWFSASPRTSQFSPAPGSSLLGWRTNLGHELRDTSTHRQRDNFRCITLCHERADHTRLCVKTCSRLCQTFRFCSCPPPHAILALSAHTPATRLLGRQHGCEAPSREARRWRYPASHP